MQYSRRRITIVSPVFLLWQERRTEKSFKKKCIFVEQTHTWIVCFKCNLKFLLLMGNCYLSFSLSYFFFSEKLLLLFITHTSFIIIILTENHFLDLVSRLVWCEGKYRNVQSMWLICNTQLSALLWRRLCRKWLHRMLL